MSLNKAQLKQRIIENLSILGFSVDNPYCRVSDLAQAIANAVVDEITENADVQVSAGSSSGTYKVS